MQAENRNEKDTDAQQVSTMEEETTEELLKVVSNVLQTMVSSTRILEEYVYDLKDQVSRLPEGTKKVEALERLAENSLVKLHYTGIVQSTDVCKQLVSKALWNRRAAGGKEEDELKRKKQHEEEGKEKAVTQKEIGNSPQGKRGRSRWMKDDSGDGIYYIRLVANMANPPEVRYLFYAVINRTKVHVNLFKQQGLGAKVSFNSRAQLNDAMEALTKHTVDGISPTTAYKVEAVIKSKFSLKTGKFSHKVLKAMPYQVNGKINVAMAIETLVNRNGSVFKNEGDIEQVNLISVAEAGMYVFEIHTSRSAHKRAIAAAKKGYLLDLVNVQLVMYNMKTPDLCYKCHKAGHWMRSCPQGYFQCKFCPARHESRECPNRNDKLSYICFRCRGYNTKRGTGKPFHPENHQATSGKCTTPATLVDEEDDTQQDVRVPSGGPQHKRQRL